MSTTLPPLGGQAYQQCLDNARLVDLREGRTVKLPNEQELVIGLTLHDKLTAEIPSQTDGSIIIEFCTVLRETDGHWLQPNRDLPCLIDDTDVWTDILLSQGSTIKIGDRYLRYNYPAPLRNETASGMDTGPPPKPRRAPIATDTAEEKLEDLKDPGGSANEHDESPNGSPELSESEWCVVSLTTLDEELMQLMSSPEELANLAASNVCRQITMHTDLLMATAEIDFLFKVLQHVSQSCQSILLQFVTEYNQMTKSSHSEQVCHISQAAKPIHGPVVHLLTDLLRMSLDPVDHVILWLKLLATLSRFTQNLSEFLACKTTAVVQGAMAAYMGVSLVQQYSCAVLAQVAMYKPMVVEKGPLRESGVELLVCALNRHHSEPLVLRPACRALANLTCTYATMTAELVTSGALSEEMEACITRSVSILDMIEEKAFKAILNIMHRYAGDLSIQAEGCRLLAFFTEKDGSVMEGFNPYDAVDGGFTSVPHKRKTSNVSETNSSEDLNVIEPFKEQGENPSPSDLLSPQEVSKVGNEVSEEEEDNIYEDVEILQPFRHTEDSARSKRENLNTRDGDGDSETYDESGDYCELRTINDSQVHGENDSDYEGSDNYFPDPGYAIVKQSVRAEGNSDEDSEKESSKTDHEEDEMYETVPDQKLNSNNCRHADKKESGLPSALFDQEPEDISNRGDSNKFEKDTGTLYVSKETIQLKKKEQKKQGEKDDLYVSKETIQSKKKEQKTWKKNVEKDSLYVSKETIQSKKKEQKAQMSDALWLDSGGASSEAVAKGTEEDPIISGCERKNENGDIKNSVPEKPKIAFKELHFGKSTEVFEIAQDAPVLLQVKGQVDSVPLETGHNRKQPVFGYVETEPVEKESRTRRWLNKLRRNKGSYSVNQQEDTKSDTNTELDTHTNVDIRTNGSTLERNIRIGQEMALLKEGPGWLRRKLNFGRKQASYNVFSIPETFDTSKAKNFKSTGDHKTIHSARQDSLEKYTVTSENIKAGANIPVSETSSHDLQPNLNQEEEICPGNVEVDDFPGEDKNESDGIDYDYVTASELEGTVSKDDGEKDSEYDYVDLREIHQPVKVVKFDNDITGRGSLPERGSMIQNKDNIGSFSDSELYESIDNPRGVHFKPVEENSEQTTCCSGEGESRTITGEIPLPIYENVGDLERVGRSEDQNMYLDVVEEPEFSEEQDVMDRSRATWGAIQAPDIQTLLANQNPSLTESIEWATMVSSCHWEDQDSLGEIDHEAEKEIRINRTKFKSVIAELKVRNDWAEEKIDEATFNGPNSCQEQTEKGEDVTTVFDNKNSSDEEDVNSEEPGPEEAEEIPNTAGNYTKVDSKNCSEAEEKGTPNEGDDEIPDDNNNPNMFCSQAQIHLLLSDNSNLGCSEVETNGVDEPSPTGEEFDIDVPEEEFLQLGGGHEAVCEQLAIRTVIAGSVLSQWNEDSDEAVILLNEPVQKLLMQDTGQIPDSTAVDLSLTLTSADPALAINIFQVLSDVPLARDVALKLLQYTSELMTGPHHPSLIETAALCLRTLIESPLAQSIKDGWGFFTFRRLHKTTTSMLSDRHRNLDHSCRQAISSLHNVLESLIVYK